VTNCESRKKPHGVKPKPGVAPFFN
jgi:hypothetical protein